MRILMLLALTACGVESVEDEAWQLAAEQSPAPRTGGCGDVTLYATNSRDTRAVFINLNGLATDAVLNGGLATISGPIVGNASVSAQVGMRLTSATCVGAFPFPGPRVDGSFQVVSGQIRARVTSGASATPSLPFGTADAELTDAVFADAAGRTFTLRRLVITGVGVGFYPP